MLYGIDVSEYVTDVDPKTLVQGGCRFASIKCSDAAYKNGVWTPFLDKKHLGFTNKFRAGEIPTQSYAFGHPSMDVKTHADFFIAHAFYDQLCPVIDMESLSIDVNGQKIVPPNAGPWTFNWLSYVLGRTGVRPMQYASTSYMSAMLKQKPELKQFKIWLAEYHIPPTTDRLPKTDFEYVCWQFGGDVKLDGVTGFADRDVTMKDDLSDLYVEDPQL